MSMIKLRPYQQEAVDLTISALKKSIDPVVIEAATGAGKSLIVAELARWLNQIAPTKKVLCFAPSKELIEQNTEKYKLTGNRASIFCASTGNKCLNHPVIFCSPLTTKNAIEQVAKMAVSAIILDECFTGDTLVSTPFGDKEIHSMRKGDIVYNAIGTGVVETVSKNNHYDIYTVSLSNGQKIKTTGNHPFFTECGWVNAENLAGKGVICLQDMPLLWNKDDSNQAKQIKRMFRERKAVQKKDMLLKLLLKEAIQSNLEGRSFRKNDRNIKAYWSQANFNWRKWQRANRATKTNDRNTRGWVENGIAHKNKCRSSEWGLSECLQSRYWERGSKNSHRIGRRVSQREKEITRCKKRQFTKIIRVESVKVEKSGCTTPMYNLQVSGHPSYFAGGVLVHNCHTLTPTILGIIDRVKENNPNCRIIGMTATPYRMNSGYIYAIDEWGDKVHESKAKDPFFSRLVYRITAPALIEQGFLTPPKLLDAGLAYDTSQLTKNNMGNFESDELRMIFEESSLTQKIIDSIIYAAENCQGVMLFSTTVDHAKEILKIFPAGECRLVTGETPKKEREEIIEMFKAKLFKYLLNVSCLTTGFDAPHVDFIAVLRPTESRGLYQQIIGRGTRLSDNKEHFIVMDCAGNIDRHGLSASDMFTPEIPEIPECKSSQGEVVICPVCGFENENKIVEVKGKVISTLRRCANITPIEGIENPILARHFTRCSYYFKSRECEQCGSENDITARKCRNKKCNAILISPDDKLDIGSKQTTFTHEITSFDILPHKSKAGNDGYFALVNGKYRVYFATHTKRGLAEYEKALDKTPKEVIIKTAGKYPELLLVW